MEQVSEAIWNTVALLICSFISSTQLSLLFDTYSHIATPYQITILGSYADCFGTQRDFLFNKDTRDRFLFEDTQFTHLRKYFRALQALSAISDSCNQMTETWKLYHEIFEKDESKSSATG